MNLDINFLKLIHIIKNLSYKKKYIDINILLIIYKIVY